jgi:hypothetical protein
MYGNGDYWTWPYCASGDISMRSYHCWQYAYHNRFH